MLLKSYETSDFIFFIVGLLLVNCYQIFFFPDLALQPLFNKIIELNGLYFKFHCTRRGIVTFVMITQSTSKNYASFLVVIFPVASLSFNHLYCMKLEDPPPLFCTPVKWTWIVLSKEKPEVTGILDLVFFCSTGEWKRKGLHHWFCEGGKRGHGPAMMANNFKWDCFFNDLVFCFSEKVLNSFNERFECQIH